ncbi:hypothetical protein J132_05133 [Termitomyces sp. J132]|nr:hypothetical protein J132_05133 [Termitomyces sp. J132]
MALQEQRIHPKFHVLLLQLYKSSDDVLFPNRATPEPYDFGMPDNQEWFVGDMIDHWWMGTNLEFKVWWSLRDTTWEYLAMCKDLEALDYYLKLQGIPVQLARMTKSS